MEAIFLLKKFIDLSSLHRWVEKGRISFFALAATIIRMSLK